PNYYRLAINKIVRLKYLGLRKCIGTKFDSQNNVTELLCELLPKNFIPDKKVKGTINWVSEKDCLNITIRKYDYLIPNNFDESKEWKSQLNKNSLTIINAVSDISIKNAKPYDKFQFERIGYFVMDPDSNID